MRIVSTHQSSFLPYTGFWWKVMNSDIFIINTASDFSTTSMYYRTYMPKKAMPSVESDELDYWTVGINRKIITRSDAIGDVQLKPETMAKLKNQFISYCALYKKNGAPETGAVKRYLLPVFDNEFKYLHQLNQALFEMIKDWLYIGCKVYVNYTHNFNDIDDKSKRLAHQLLEFCDNEVGTFYISGSSGRNYLDEPSFKEIFKSSILYQQEQADADFYHGSILHYMFMHPRELVQSKIADHFTWRYK